MQLPGSACGSEPTSQLSSLGSLMSWTVTYSPSARELVELEEYGDSMGGINEHLKPSLYLEVWISGIVLLLGWIQIEGMTRLTWELAFSWGLSNKVNSV